MQTVAELLADKGHTVWTIDPDASVLDAIRQMAAKNLGALVVVEGAETLGIVTERLYARSVANTGGEANERRVRDIMRTDIPRVTPDTSLETCMGLVTRCRTRHLPVLAGEELVGLVSIGDLVAAIIARQQSTIEQLESYIASG